MNKLHRILAAGLIAAAGGGLAAAPVLAADATTSPTESPAVQTQTPQQSQPQQQTKTRAHHQHSKASRAARVERLQQALNKNGASLKVDGKWGPSTESALKSFQKDHGLKVTGRMDKETRSQLRKKS